MMKLVKDKRIRKYELTYLLPVALTSSEVATAKEAIEQLLKKHKITIVSQDDWGRKFLAYPIKYKSKKQNEAFFTHMSIEAEASKISKLENDLYLNHEIIRHLVVSAQDSEVKAE